MFSPNKFKIWLQCAKTYALPSVMHNNILLKYMHLFAKNQSNNTSLFHLTIPIYFLSSNAMGFQDIQYDILNPSIKFPA